MNLADKINMALAAAGGSEQFLPLSGGTLTGPITGTGGIIEQRDGLTTQELQVYGTYTDANNWERLALRTAAGNYLLGVESNGSGSDRGLVISTQANWLEFVANGSRQFVCYNNELRFSKRLGTGGVSTIDIGASGEPFRHGYFGALTLSSLPTADPNAAGQIWNDAGTLKISAD